MGIEDNFVHCDLVYVMNRSPVYLLAVLSGYSTRLFSGRKDTLTEVREYGFPFSFLDGVAAQADPSQDISYVCN